MTKRHKAELRAGLFLNLGLLLIMVVLFLFRSSFSIVSSSDEFHFRVPDAQGLIVGSKVLVAGLEAGQVDRLELDEGSGNVRVDVGIDRQFRRAIRVDSGVELGTQGVLGDRVVVITAGNPSQPEVPPGGNLRARVSPGLNQVVGRVAGKSESLVKNLNQVLEDANGSGQVRRITENAARTFENLNELTGKLNQGVDAEDVQDALDQVNAVLAKLNSGTGSLGALLNDPALYDDAKALVGEANRNRIVRNLVRNSIKDAKESKESQELKELKELKDQEKQRAGQLASPSPKPE